MTLKIKSWSYSQLSDYEACAHAYMYRRVVKLPEEPSYHLITGNNVHILAEKFLLGELEVLPTVLNKFDKEFHKLKRLDAKSEEAFVFDNKWNRIPDGWSHEDAWLRLKLDARIGNYIIDFKTGRKYDAHKAQGRLYANAYMMYDKSVDEVDVEFWYLNSGEVEPYTFYRKDLETDIADWERRVAIMHNDTSYTPTPHQWCRNCYVKHICTNYS